MTPCAATGTYRILPESSDNPTKHRPGGLAYAEEEESFWTYRTLPQSSDNPAKQRPGGLAYAEEEEESFCGVQ